MMKKMSRLAALGLLAFSFLTGTTAMAQATPGEFTIVALPDTQIYAKSYPGIFASQTRWIADHKADMNIQLVVGLGDIVDAGGNTTQWQNADAAYRTLDGVVPYMAAIGNHDYDANNPAGRTGSTKNFNTYFGPSRYAGKSYYAGSYPAGSNENFYGIVNLGGKPYLVLVLECFPRDAALNWAAGVIKANADKSVIIVTHAFTYADNMRMSKCDSNSSYSFGVGTDNDGEDTWTKLASLYPNVVMVLSGHVVQGDGTGRRVDYGVNGNLVNEILADYQSWTNGGNGYMRVMTFQPALNQVVVRTYSPYLNAWLTDSHNQFTVPLKAVGMTSVLAQGALSGKVKSAIDCSPLANVGVTANGLTVMTDSTGKFNFPLAGPQMYGVTAKRSGWGSGTKVGAVVPGQASPMKFLMATSGVLKGTVVTNVGAALGGATVTITGGALKTTKTFTSDSAGNYNAGWIAVGTYTVRASKAGYNAGSTSTTVNTGLTTTAKVAVQ
jgi:Calcineurin-like phosphoesterase/Carboxypeptidase regulatory-like domain